MGVSAAFEKSEEKEKVYEKKKSKSLIRLGIKITNASLNSSWWIYFIN